MATDVGVPLEPGSQVIMQVHYNLLAGPQPGRLRGPAAARAGRRRTSPRCRRCCCRRRSSCPAAPATTTVPLCDRDGRRGRRTRSGSATGGADRQLPATCSAARCEAGPVAAPATGRVTRPMTIRAVAGHMHLLGRSIRIEVDPGTPQARTVLDIPVWDFDNQGAQADRRRCTWSPATRSGSPAATTSRCATCCPAFEGQPERYVVWGEGTTDEMCLGILLVTRP